MNGSSFQPSSTGPREHHVIASCPMCASTYHPLTTRVIAARADDHLLYLECRHCGSRVVALVTADAAGMHSVGVVTDLTSAELVTLAQPTAVTTDDVLDLYAWDSTHPSVVSTL